MRRPRQPAVSRSVRILIVDQHEVTRAACAALLRTEGWEVSDVAPGCELFTLVEALEPNVVLIDATPGERVCDSAKQLRRLACAPTVLVTSSARPEQLDPCLGELPFVAKADICAAAILHAVATPSS
jgi:CheY-like chemotaxis protein